MTLSFSIGQVVQAQPCAPAGLLFGSPPSLYAPGKWKMSFSRAVSRILRSLSSSSTPSTPVASFSSTASACGSSTSPTGGLPTTMPPASPSHWLWPSSLVPASGNWAGRLAMNSRYAVDLDSFVFGLVPFGAAAVRCHSTDACPHFCDGQRRKLASHTHVMGYLSA